MAIIADIEWGLPRERVVTGCGDCPFFNVNACTCDHHSRPDEHRWTCLNQYKPLPDWCPLRGKPVLVVMREKKG